VSACRIAAVALLALLAASAVHPAPAHADADPASDILLTQDVFVPLFGGQPSEESERYLEDVVDAANDDGYVIKVAAIGDRRDLGGVFSLFGKPQRYAPFLGRELAFTYKGPLLTSMPAGFGFYWQGQNTARERRIIRTVPVKPGMDGLVDSTAEAVKKLAAANGHPIDVEKGGGGFGVPVRAILIAAGAAVVLLLVAVPLILRSRRRATA
jgi:hypothetical protein